MIVEIHAAHSRSHHLRSIVGLLTAAVLFWACDTDVGAVSHSAGEWGGGMPGAPLDSGLVSSVGSGSDAGPTQGAGGSGVVDGGSDAEEHQRPVDSGGTGGGIIMSDLEPSIKICNGATPSLGKGSFARARPAGQNGPATTIYKTASVKGAMPTNDWWSSLAWQQYSQPMFPHPLAIMATAAGLAVSGPVVSGSKDAIMGSFVSEFTLGSTASANYPDARVDGFSDWTVTMAWADASSSLQVTAGHGLPFLYARYKGGKPQLSFQAMPTVFAGGADQPALGITVGGRSYGLYAPSGSHWSGVGTTTLTNDLAGKDYFSIALLPDGSAATLGEYGKYAYSFVVDTSIDFHYDEAAARLDTSYRVTTESKEGSATGTIMGLYPHQWKATKTQLAAYTYETVRGAMKTVAGDSFTTSMPFHGILPMLPAVTATGAECNGTLVDQSTATSSTPSADIYWMGKEMGRLVNLSPLAQQTGNSAAAAQILDRLERTVADYLEAAPGETGHLFSYDSNWGTLIGYPATYGIDTPLNDHHFQYGYWIRAAAEIARLDPTWAKRENWGTMVQLLIQDIAGWDRTDSCFPRLRNFDPYAGHSWASGDATFADGNNNESSSEGMNAWAGLILWGEATGDRTIRDLGIYLYITEASAIEQYWFNVDGDNLKQGYGHNVAAMIWGGKTVYATWFSGDPQMIRGINILPLSAASSYLGYHPSRVLANLAELQTEFGSNHWTSWTDVLWGYQAFADAPGALALFHANPGYVPEAGESRAHTGCMLESLAGVGTVDLDVTADTVLYNVFKKGDSITHAAYNSASEPRVVHFSDDVTMTVSPGKLGVR